MHIAYGHLGSYASQRWRLHPRTQHILGKANPKASKSTFPEELMIEIALNRFDTTWTAHDIEHCHAEIFIEHGIMLQLAEVAGRKRLTTSGRKILATRLS